MRSLHCCNERFRSAMLVVSVLVYDLAVTPPPAAAQPAIPDPVTARDMILAGRRRNYSAISSATAEIIYQNALSPDTLAQRRKMAADSLAGADGISLMSEEEVLAEHRMAFTLNGDQLRFDGGVNPSSTVIVAGDQLTTYQPNGFAPDGKEFTGGLQSIRPSDTRRGPYRDPREVLFNESSRLEDALLRATLKNVTRETTDDGRSLLVLSCEMSGGEQVWLACDERRNYLPVHVWETLGASTPTLASCEISYNNAGSEAAPIWFPQLLQFKLWGLFEAAKVTNSVPDKGWTSNQMFRIVNLTINPTVDDSTFVLEPPDGTYVSDSISRTTKVVGQALTPEATQGLVASIWKSWFTTLALVVAAVVLAFLIRRRRTGNYA
jgi:hypothetical protein